MKTSKATLLAARVDTSVDSERLFSTAANVVDEKRNRLTSKNAEMLIFLDKNLALMLKK